MHCSMLNFLVDHRYVVIKSWTAQNDSRKGSIVSSCLYINEVSRNVVVWESVFGHVDFALMSWSTAAATSMYLTIGITAKIQYMRQKLRKVHEHERYSSFLSTTAAAVESGLLSTVFQVCMLAAYARNSTVNLIFLGVTVQTNVCHY